MSALPRVKFSIIDKSLITQPVEGNVRLYFPIFSEKGIDGEIVKVSTPEQFVNLFGAPNKFKYGNGAYYVIKALQYQDVTCHILRITPNDATYANASITFEELVTKTIQEDVNNSDTIKLDSVDGLAVGDEVVIYSTNSEIPKYTYATITNVDTTNNEITVDKTITAAASDYVTKIPAVTVINKTISGSLDSVSVDVNEILFYATGKGKYYNNIKLQFIPDETIENYYAVIDENTQQLVPLLPGMFYQMQILEQKPGSEPRILENTLTVSFVSTTQDGNPVVHPASGEPIFIETQVNNKAYHVNVKVGEQLEQELIDKSFIYGYALKKYFITNSVKLGNGSDGTMDYLTQKSLLIEAYNGTLNRAASQIREAEYPFKAFEVDYVVDYTGDPDVQSAVLDFAKYRMDTVAIISPIAKTLQENLNYRLNVMNSSVYFGTIVHGTTVEIFDPYTKRNIELPNSFTYMDSNLYVDVYMDFTVPVAGLNGGAVRTPVKITYNPSKYEAEQMAKFQINPLVKTPSNQVFFLTQYTMYKRPTYLQRLNIVKTIFRFKKDLYPKLYQLLQRKATPDVLEEANRILKQYFDNYLVNRPKYGILEDYKIELNFDKATNTLEINITLKFVGIIEEINVNFIIVNQ